MTKGDKILYSISAIVFALLAVLPIFGVLSGLQYRTLTLTLMYAVMAIAWNWLGGYTGYSAFGNAAFFGIGATAPAVFMVKLGWAFVPATIAGAILCAGVGVLMGPALLRLKGHYFAVATLGVANAAREISAGWDNVTGGGLGINLPLNTNYDIIYYAFLGLAVGGTILTHVISRGRLGYGWMAIRENEDGAKALGIDATLYKSISFVMGCFLVGLVGGVWAYYNGTVNPDVGFDQLLGTTPILIAILGGTGSVIGPIVGSLILQPLATWLSFTFPGIQQSLLGIIIILVIIFLPRGLYEYVSGHRRFTLAELLKSPRENHA